MTQDIFKSWAHLPRPDYRVSWGQRFLCYAPNKQVFEVMSYGPSWLAITPVHVGTLATLPAAASVPPHSRAILTDQTYTLRTNAAGTAWVQEGAAASSGPAYAGPVADLPAANSLAAWSKAVLTDVRNLELMTDGTSWRPPGGHMVAHRLESEFAQAATPGTTKTTAATVVLPVPLLRVGAELRIQLAADKVGGTSDTATVSLELNGTLIHATSLATSTRTVSLDLRYLVSSATALSKIGSGSSATGWGGGASNAARPGSVALNNVTTTTNTLIAYLQMTSGAVESAILNSLDIEILS